jgi:hypothetical protein
MVKDLRNYLYNPDGVSNDTLDATRYLKDKTEMMQTIIDSLAPDYLSLENEPMTAQHNLFGLVRFTPENTLYFVNYFMDHLVTHGIPIGTGAGSWDNIQYFENYVTTKVDFIDFHTYPIYKDFFVNKVFIIDSLAKLHNKKIVVGECWCHKETLDEFNNGKDVLNETDFMSRNVFSYWYNVDTLFIKAMVNLSQSDKFEYVNFFNSNAMFGQIPWDSPYYDSLSSYQLLNIGQTVEYSNMAYQTLGELGTFTKNLISNINNPEAVQDNNQTYNDLVYPNPFNYSTTIQLQQNIGNSNLIIYNIFGQIVRSTNVSGNKIIVERDNLPAGVYFYRITQNNEIIVSGKLMIMD